MLTLFNNYFLSALLGPLVNCASWITTFILFIAIYTGNNPIYSQPSPDEPKSFRKSLLNAFRINYIFWALIIFFAMKGEFLHPQEL
jgi:hypothetical protein